MLLATTDASESLAALAARVYDLGETPTPAATRVATAALVAANPFLKQAAHVPTGTVIDVPPLPNMQPAAGAAGTEQATAAALAADRVRAAAALAQRQLLADVESEIGSAEATVKLGRSAELKQLRSATPGLADALPRTIAVAQDRVTAAKEVGSRQKAVFEQIALDLTELGKAFAGAGEGMVEGA